MDLSFLPTDMQYKSKQPQIVPGKNLSQTLGKASSPKVSQAMEQVAQEYGRIAVPGSI